MYLNFKGEISMQTCHKYKIIMLLTISILMLACLRSDQPRAIQRSDVISAENIIGLNFTNTERDSLLKDLQDNREAYIKIRKIAIPNQVPPALTFNPIPAGFKPKNLQNILKLSPPRQQTVPKNREELCFYTVRDLGELIRTRKITSVELTQLYLSRLKKYDPKLHCVISLTEDLAMQEARAADQEIAAGNYRGPLHGIPYGAKDLLAVKNYKTTWGARPYQDQVIDQDATVIKKLRAAGAVLLAKLSMGALAWGDVWYGGTTRNPWNLQEGSSGSSAGSAAATAAGLVPFAIGTETWGSIVSPSTRCGTSGLRPTFGRVSRSGAMALSWSMDKIGPICRSVEDCAIVLQAISGPDNEDQSVCDFPCGYEYDMDLGKLKVGYLRSAFEEKYDQQQLDQESLNVFRQQLNVQLIPITLPDLPVQPLAIILNAEAAAAFDELTRSNRDDLMVRQVREAWPNVFRASRFIPAVEYIQANRIRYLLIAGMQKLFEQVDIYIAPSFAEDNLLLTNLSGHPCVVLPNGFDQKGSPTSISFIGNLFDEGRLLVLANAYQQATSFHKQYPPQFKVSD
jgi:Asp-tRNA(Asn)/Glu-tRNA(Gln) amidotransferase A subunit family amidase